ncbi:MAG: AIR synthase family protein [Candidatus Bathyarchaeota archaeon]|nr:AIR synthase family protein [Candidatus Bathyarchaeota archaeon]MCX8176880.1 AIR synthase family protein [Candidatus Bathyarchaeota archaeon]MDW8193435.1 AIR synthase family protein [Nitrososphaerota archaeon]
MHLPFGKVPAEILKDIVFRNLGEKRSEVVVGPSVGVDGAVIELGDKVLITSMDPITGALKRIGWLAVNVNANDIATFGVRPAYFSSCILLPEGADEQMLETICTQIDEAAKDLGMAVVGGHCELTPALTGPVVVGCAVGITGKGRYVTAKDAKPGDKLLLTKSAGIEGTAILASDFYRLLIDGGISEELLMSARRFFEEISVVKDGILAFETGGVDAMHDPTEGGVLGGIHELADASNLGVKVFEDRIPVAEETIEICKFFNIDPLQLISSGVMLIAAKENCADEVLNVLIRNGVQVSFIGEFLETPKTRVLVKSDGSQARLPKPDFDHLWLAIHRALKRL